MPREHGRTRSRWTAKSGWLPRRVWSRAKTHRPRSGYTATWSRRCHGIPPCGKRSPTLPSPASSSNLRRVGHHTCRSAQIAPSPPQAVPSVPSSTMTSKKRRCRAAAALSWTTQQAGRSTRPTMASQVATIRRAPSGMPQGPRGSTPAGRSARRPPRWPRRTTPRSPCSPGGVFPGLVQIHKGDLVGPAGLRKPWFLATTVRKIQER